MANGSQLGELRRTLGLVRYDIDKILESVEHMSKAEDIARCCDDVTELLNITLIIRAAVEVSIGLATVDHLSPTTRPPAMQH